MADAAVAVGRRLDPVGSRDRLPGALAEFGTLLTGRRTYQQVDLSAPPFKGQRIVVFSRTLRAEDCPGVTVVSAHIAEVILDQQDEPALGGVDAPQRRLAVSRQDFFGKDQVVVKEPVDGRDADAIASKVGWVGAGDVSRRPRGAGGRRGA